MATTKEISSLETISGNSALLLGKTAIGNVGFIQGVLAADGKVTGLAEVEGRLDALEAVTIDQVFDKDSEKAHSGKAVEDAFKKHSTLQGDTGTAYMANELTGGLIKFTTTAGDAGKVTTYDASDSEHTLVQIEANNSDKSKAARINFTVEGAFYSKDPSGTAVAVADNELATKGDIKKFQEDDPVFQAHIQDTTVHTTAEEKATFADKYTKAESDAALALKADQTAVDAALELKADKTAMEAALELKADKTTVAEQLALKADKDAFEAHANDLTKHLGTIKGAKGDALIFNEGDGGGVRFTNTDGSGSLIAVNDSTDNVYAQFSAHTKDKAKITRLNANPDGIYYTKNAADNTVTADNEIVTKADIAPLATKQSVTELDARVQVLEAVEVDQTYKPESTNAQSGTAVAEAIKPLAVKTEVDAALDLKADKTTVQEITDRIPHEASKINQLADKEYVTAMIRKGTAHFRGSWKTVADIPEDTEQYPEDMDGNKIPQEHDYLIVFEDENHENHTWEYRYVGVWGTNGKSGWTAIYEITDSPLTPAQLAAMNSGITAEIVATISQKATQTDLNALQGRVATLEAVEVDQTYNGESTNAQSGTAVAEAIAPLAVKATVDAALAKKADQSSVDTALAAKADASALTSGLAGKASQTDLEALQATVTALQAKVTELESQIAGAGA